MHADQAVLAAVHALAQSPLRPGVLDDVTDVAQLRKQVSLLAPSFFSARAHRSRDSRRSTSRLLGARAIGDWIRARIDRSRVITPTPRDPEARRTARAHATASVATRDRAGPASAPFAPARTRWSP